MSTQIKRPDVIQGYVHPTNNSYSKNSQYKTFTDTSILTEKTDTDGYDANIKEVGKSYATTNTVNESLCPVCEEKAIHVCQCAYNDKICVNGHSWYTNRKLKVVMGTPHKNSNIMEVSCNK